MYYIQVSVFPEDCRTRPKFVTDKYANYHLSSIDDNVYIIIILETVIFFNHPVHCNLSEDIQQSCLSITNVGV